LSCISMIIIAWKGGGVWTLIGGNIIREAIRTVLLFTVIKWRPKIHFNFDEIKPFLKFGINILLSTTIYYAYYRADRFFGGREIGSIELGYYALALQLAVIPTEKIVTLINSVAYPVFSRLQRAKNDFNRFFLQISNLIALFTFPLFTGGMYIAEELIVLFVGEKWLPTAAPFAVLCLSKMVDAIFTPLKLVHIAQNRTKWPLIFDATLMPFLVGAFWFASNYHSIYILALPWLAVFIPFMIGFLILTLKKIDVKVWTYVRSIAHPAIATGLMIFVLFVVRYTFRYFQYEVTKNRLIFVTFSILAGFIVYSSYILLFQRKLLVTLFTMAKKKEV